MRDSRLVYLLIGALGGILLTILASAMYWTAYERQIRLKALTLEIVDRSHNLVPLLINLEEQNLEDLKGTARNQLVSGIAISHSNLSALDEQGQEIVSSVLESIAAKRSRMKIGKYASPPQETIEQILAQYD